MHETKFSAVARRLPLIAILGGRGAASEGLLSPGSLRTVDADGSFSDDVDDVANDRAMDMF